MPRAKRKSVSLSLESNTITFESPMWVSDDVTIFYYTKKVFESTDLHCEIMKYLPNDDLIRVARTCKLFYSVLRKENRCWANKVGKMVTISSQRALLKMKQNEFARHFALNLKFSKITTLVPRDDWKALILSDSAHIQSFPAALETLVIVLSSTPTQLFTRIPKTLRTLIFGKNYHQSWNDCGAWVTGQPSYIQFPAHLQNISLGNYFSAFCKFPPGLRMLRIGHSRTHLLEFPSSLLFLSLGHTPNMSVAQVPPLVEHLEISQTAAKLILPPNLKRFYWHHPCLNMNFQVNNNRNVVWYHNQKRVLKQLSNLLEDLNLVNCFCMPCNLPASLRHLSLRFVDMAHAVEPFQAPFKHLSQLRYLCLHNYDPLVLEELPDSLEILVLGFPIKKPKSVSTIRLHSNLKLLYMLHTNSLIIEHHFRYAKGVHSMRPETDHSYFTCYYSDERYTKMFDVTSHARLHNNLFVANVCPEVGCWHVLENHVSQRSHNWL